MARSETLPTQKKEGASSSFKLPEEHVPNEDLLWNAEIDTSGSFSPEQKNANQKNIQDKNII